MRAEGATADYFVVSGTDNTATSSVAFSASDFTKLNTSDDVHYVTASNWPNGVASFDANKYLEFLFQPNIPSDAIIDSVKITHEFRRDSALDGRKLSIWDGASFTDYALTNPANNSTDSLQEIDLSSQINTATKVNNLKARFLAFKTTAIGGSVKTRHDFVKLSVDYHLPAPVQHTLTYTAGANGSLDSNLPQVVQMVNEGEDGTAVTAVADAGYHFVDWSDGLTNNPRTDLNVVSDISVTANFAADVVVPGSYTISASAGTGGSISPLGMINVTENTDQAFAITPDANFQIADVLVDSVSVGAVASYNFAAVTANHSISATFAPVTHVLNITADNGAVTKNPDQASYDHDTMVELMATPNAGYTFSGWSGDLSGSANPTSVTLDSDKNVTANFVADPVPPTTHTITATSSAGGVIDPSGAVSVAAGADQVFTFTPDPGFELSELLIDSATSTATSTYTFLSVTADHTIAVTFSAIATSTATTTPPAEDPAPSSGENNSSSGGSSGGSQSVILPTGGEPNLSDAERAQLLALLESIKQRQTAQNIAPTGQVLGVNTLATDTNADAELGAPTSSVATTTPAGDNANVFGKFGRWIAGLFGRIF